MKKYITIIIAVFLMSIVTAGFAFPPPNNNIGGSTVRAGINYNNPVRTVPQGHPINNITVPSQLGGWVVVSNETFLPPPHPPKRAKYKYSDFGDNRQLHKRSYYIPSYCMPQREFYSNYNNPFCSQYKPYGSNMYLGF